MYSNIQGIFGKFQYFHFIKEVLLIYVMLLYCGRDVLSRAVRRVDYLLRLYYYIQGIFGTFKCIYYSIKM
jgi:hypothetical protein